jgi:hypothetical protein
LSAKPKAGKRSAKVMKASRRSRSRNEPAWLTRLMSEIKEHMEIIGADGVHVGTVDKVEGNRIKLTKKDSGEGVHTRAITISSIGASWLV